MGEEPKEVRAELLKVASGYALPIFWADPGFVLHSGTAFILNTGNRVFGVTAGHVYRDYVRDFTSGATQTCHLGSINIPLQERLISISTEGSIDIATFELKSIEVNPFRERILSGAQKNWPPAPPVEGQSTIVAGFPKFERIQRAKFDCSFGAVSFNIPISFVTDIQFGCVFEREHWEMEFGKGFPEVNCNFGGISGAPVITPILSELGIASWQLAGVAYQSSSEGHLGEVLFVNHAHLISEQGDVGKRT